MCSSDLEINEDNGLISGEPALCAHAQIDERKGLLHGELALLLRKHNERLTKTKACTYRILTGGRACAGEQRMQGSRVQYDSKQQQPA